MTVSKSPDPTATVRGMGTAASLVKDFLVILNRDASPEQQEEYACSHAVIPDADQFWSNFRTARQVSDLLDPSALRGHFALASRSGSVLRILTDAGGMVPIFYASTAAGWVVGTRQDEVAEHAGASVDPTSVYDFLGNGAICHPYTWFEGVRVCDPASLIVFDAQTGAIEESPYWVPPAKPRHTNLKSAAQALSKALRRAVQDAVEGQPVSILYSGGEDSRVIGALAKTERKGFLFLPRANRELVLARTSASLLGFSVDHVVAPPKRYVEQQAAAFSLIGPGFDVAHAHALGCVETIPRDRPCLGGWGSDTLFKGLYLEERKGKVLESLRATTWKNKVPAHAYEVLRRRQQHFEALYARIPRTAYEWQHFWPLSAHEHHAHFGTARRYLDQREPFLTAPLIRLAADIHPSVRADREFFRLAFSKMLGKAGYVPRSNGLIPRYNLAKNARLDPLVRAVFWLHDTFVHPKRDQGPWPMITWKPGPPRALLKEMQWFDDGRLSAWVQTGSVSRNELNRFVQIHHLLGRKTTPKRAGAGHHSLTARALGGLEL